MITPNEKIESFDCGVAPLDPDTTELGQDETLPVPEGQYIEMETANCDYCHGTLDPSEVVWYNDLPYCKGCYYDRPDPCDVVRQTVEMSNNKPDYFAIAQDITRV